MSEETPQKFYIRVMKTEDIEEAKELQTTVSVLTYSAKAWEIFATSPSFLSLLLYVEEKGEKHLAALCISERFWTSRILPKRDASINIHAIRQEYQQKGFDNLLLSVMNYINIHHFGVEHVLIENFKDNIYLFNFYKENGFIGYQIFEDYFLIKDKKFDAVCMILFKKDFKDPKIGENVELHPEVKQLMTTKDKLPCFCPALFTKP